MKKLLNLSKKGKIMIVIAGVVVVAGIIIVKSMIGGGASVDMTEATAVKQDLEKYYSFSGNIESSEVQNVVSTTNQPVKKFYAKEGDKVRAGALLYEVDSNTIQSTLTTASTSLSNAKTTYSSSKVDYERKKELYDMGGISLVELETAQDALSTAQNRVTEAQASYAQAQKQYADTKCYAEVSGEVSKIYVGENDSVMQGTSILDIVNYDDLEVNIKVDEYDLSAISEGMDAEVYFEATGKTVIGTISEIARGASVENGVSYFETTVTLPKDTYLRVGISAEVKVAAQSVKGAITVPMKAVQYDGSNAYVQQYDEKGKLQKVSVTIGINNGADIEIKNGLKEGDTVVYINTSDSSNATSFMGEAQ
ncbi:efflux RND transporter periplasmic adaptor subunit [Clostridium aminobutyricum]|uniref:Efflux RND transporter periplasmic adaptor subunit n=1 Tax=Clostridium aminobutyricum TaxID=33953 RepID=A0A939D9E9_CLOAM|nr:efflux RND transporter periplasmic adaptor subunit [Clostridium aminobutyricum]MBN7773839.1 efflux RND transporter periplasmic adaptor subunit [Clostridium aminobutyricum]